MSQLTQFQKNHAATAITPVQIAEDGNRKKDPNQYRTPIYGTGRPCHSCGSFQVNKVFQPIHRHISNADFFCDACHAIIRANWDNQKSPFPAPVIPVISEPVVESAPVKRSHQKKQTEGFSHD